MTVKSAARVIEILELLAKHPEGLRVSDVSSSLGYPLSSTHALLKTLLERNYLIADTTGNTYRLGSRFFELGSRYLDSFDVLEVVKEPMRRMRELCDETISLGIFDGEEIVIVWKNESSKALRIGNPLGSRLPVHASAMGKSIIATWPEERALDFLQNKKLKKCTPHTKTNHDSLMRELDQVRQSGIAFDLQESTDGVCAVATSIDTRMGFVKESLAIVLPSARWNGENRKSLQDLLVAGAESINSILHGIGQTASLNRTGLVNDHS